MNEKTRMDEELVAFYRERLEPLARQAEERGLKFFPVGQDVVRDSYYIDRNDDGNYIHSIDSKNIENELKTLWSKTELPELADLVKELVELANKLRESQGDESSDEVSPFIYAMF
jgi:hypothetical protein